MSGEKMDTKDDFVIRGHDMDLIRFHATEDGIYITATAPMRGRQIIIADRAEAFALLNWLRASYTEENCPEHVGAFSGAKICARCGIHVDSLRPPEGDA